jgi:hypothetical protein
MTFLCPVLAYAECPAARECEHTCQLTEPEDT